jgi:S-adenosylmethionine decarboxylase proenzyme
MEKKLIKRNFPLKKPMLVKELLVDLYSCQKGDLNDETAILTLITQAAKKAGATVLQASVHRFSPMGCSVVIILQETHISLHTWPEFGYAALDIFLCGESLDPYDSWEFIKEALQPESFEIQELSREIK